VAALEGKLKCFKKGQQMVRTAKFFACSLLVLTVSCTVARSQELNTILMNSTFEIFGPSATEPGETTFGTVFFLGKPLRTDPNKGSFVLITAAHVLDEISGDTATLVLRRKNSTGDYTKLPYTIAIRDQGKNLYVKNPEADVAAMFVSVPTVAEPMLLPISALADDTELKQLEIHPGDELLCLGFPLAVDLNTFPVVRSGLLASYPITPSKAVRQYYYNFHIFPGNSGGPVYFSFSNRIFGGGTHIGLQQGVIGLVSKQVSSTIPGFKGVPLDIAIVVPSSYIQDTIALLPEAP
jgi:S1-C subfamily serine protease